MKTWDELDRDQKRFIKQHLKRSIKDLVRKRRNTETNRAIIAAFADYEALRAIYDREETTVPADYPQRQPIEQLADAAHRHRQAGDFKRASEVIRFATSSIIDLRDRLTLRADTERAKLGPTPGVTFAPTDLALIDTARQAVMQHLTDDLPTYAQIQAADAAYPAYLAAVQSGLASLQDVDAAAAELEEARRDCGPVIEQVSIADLTPFQTTPQIGPLSQVVRDAAELDLDLIMGAEGDAKAMRALATRAHQFVRQNQAALLMAQATQHLLGIVNNAYNPVSAELIAARDSDLVKFLGQPEHGDMLQLKLDIILDVAYIETHIAAADPATLVTLNARIDQAADRADRVATLQKTVATRMLKEKLAADGAKEAHQNGIVALQETNPEAADKVIEILERDAAILNGAEATPDFIRGEKTARDTLVGERNALGEEVKALVAERDAKQERVNQLKEQEAQELARIKTLKTPSPQDLTQIMTIRAELGQARLERDSAHQKAVAKYADYQSKDRDVATKAQVIKAAENQRAMLDAVTFGPLSPMAGRPIPDDMKANVVELFGKNPALARQTCDLAATAKDPKALAETALLLADQCETNFAYTPPATDENPTPAPMTLAPDRAPLVAGAILQRTAILGAEFAADTADAIARGVPHERNPAFAGMTQFDQKSVAAVRGAQAADAMMKTTTAADGTVTVSLDLDSDAFKAVLDRQRFSDHGNFRPSTMMNVEMEKLQDFFGDPDKGADRKARAEAMLNSVNVPTSPAAREILTTSLGIPAADFDDPAKVEEVKQKVRTAILKAMVTPVAQGSVGSCFATSPLRNLREDDPLAVMQMYTDIATTGIYRPKQGRPIPAVTKRTAGDEPLTRSLEYSVAAASASLTNSRERARINRQMLARGGSVEQMKSVVSADDWRTLEPQLQAAVMGGYIFTYDPTKKATGSNDGSSDRGVLQMVDIVTKQPITTEAEFVNYVRSKALHAVARAGLPDTVRDDVIDYVNGQAFLDETKRLFGKNPPWALAFGGFGDEAGDALEGKGGRKRKTPLVDIDASDSEAQRALKVLAGMGGLDDQQMTMVGTAGMHSFNALPPEGPMKDLMTGDVQQNIQDMLIKPGKDIADTEFPIERAVYCYDQQMELALRLARSPEERAEIEKVLTQRPTTAMKPAKLEEHISQKLTEAKKVAVDVALAKWEQEATAKGAPPTPAQKADKKTAIAETRDAWVRNRVTARLIQDMGAPEFIIADSNWGSESDHTLFVIAPDPLTGEARMWSKSVTTGELYPMEEKWLKAKWEVED